MNKSDLIDYISQKANLPRKQAEGVVNTIFNTMTQTLVDGGRIEIRGFGSFVRKFYEEYEGRDPRTGKTIHVAPKYLPFFKVGKELHALVNGEHPAPSDP